MIGTYDDHQTFAMDFSGNLFSYGHGNAPFPHYAQEDLIVMQATGLTDKNGVEIFEGDVLGSGGIVEWCVDGWKKRLKTPKGDRFYSLFPNRDDLGEQIYEAVTGNIYENPELLK